jgi:hypothetical protein
MICLQQPATVPNGWGAVDLSLCYAPVQPGISKEDAPSGGRGEATNPEQGATTFGRQGDPVRRRELVLLLGGVMMTAPAVRAQQKAMPVIGILGSGAPRAFAPAVAAFLQGLGETGYVEGQNVTIEYRWAEGRYDRLPSLAADLVTRKVDGIAAIGGTPPALAAKDATATIPIVFGVGDAIELGLITSLARPGGNLTGVSVLGDELTPKRFELLSELAPGQGDRPTREPEERVCRTNQTERAGSGAREGNTASNPASQRRGRDRRRLPVPR